MSFYVLRPRTWLIFIFTNLLAVVSCSNNLPCFFTNLFNFIILFECIKPLIQPSFVFSLSIQLLCPYILKNRACIQNYFAVTQMVEYLIVNC